MSGAARTGKIGDGKLWVTPIDTVVRVAHRSAGCRRAVSAVSCGVGGRRGPGPGEGRAPRPGRGQAQARARGAADGAGGPARLLAVVAGGGHRADRPRGAGGGRRAGPPRAGPVVGPRPGAAARRSQGRRAAGRAAVVPAVGRRDRARPLGAHARPGRPGGRHRPACRVRPAGGPAHRRRRRALGQGARRGAAGVAGRHPRPVRRARRHAPRSAGARSATSRTGWSRT